MISRRRFLGTTGAAGLALSGRKPADSPALAAESAQQLPPLRRPTGTPEAVARDEAYWQRVAARYRVSSGYTNMEAGYFGMMAAPVLAAYHREIDRVNFESSYFARRTFPAEAEAARRRVAEYLRVKPTEIVITRGATEALQRLIVQYNKVRAGDTVMYADLDYNAMQFAMDSLAERRGARVARFDLPEQADRAGILAAYERALAANPGVKLLLLTHLNNKNGLVIPVKEIAALARTRGADVVVDAAHSFGQCDLGMADLGADFVGLNLHKWLGAPVGAGVMYVREGRLGDLDRMLGDDGSLDRIESRLHTGTTNFATVLTIPAALDWHEAVGPAYKAARVRYLRNRWVEAARRAPGVDVITPDADDVSAAISSFRIRGRTGRAENQAVAAELLDRYRLFTVWRTGLSGGDCVRVTPTLYNTPADADRLAAALGEIAARG
ncbi:MAG: aminotransferase class V-fold PLP-dependent enzyme [Gemmatimonadales bacterium]